MSQVYQTIAFSRLADLIPFASKFRLERVIVDAAKTLELQVSLIIHCTCFSKCFHIALSALNDLQLTSYYMLHCHYWSIHQVRIDHRSKSLSFGTDLMVAQKEDVPEGPYIQSMPSEGIRNQLISMARALHQAIERIEPKDRKVRKSYGIWYFKVKDKMFLCYDCRNLAQLLSHFNMRSGLIYDIRLIWCTMQIKLNVDICVWYMIGPATWDADTDCKQLQNDCQERTSENLTEATDHWGQEGAAWAPQWPEGKEPPHTLNQYRK